MSSTTFGKKQKHLVLICLSHQNTGRATWKIKLKLSCRLHPMIVLFAKSAVIYSFSCYVSNFRFIRRTSSENKKMPASINTSRLNSYGKRRNIGKGHKKLTNMSATTTSTGKTFLIDAANIFLTLFLFHPLTSFIWFISLEGHFDFEVNYLSLLFLTSAILAAAEPRFCYYIPIYIIEW